MTDKKSVQQIRAELYARAFGQSGDERTVSTPFETDAMAVFVELLTGEKPDEDASSLAIQGDLFREIGIDVDWEERGSGPMVKDEMLTLLDELGSKPEPEPEPEPEEAFGLIGSVDKDEESTEARSLDPVDPSESHKRYKSLLALANHGPGQATEIGQEVQEQETPEGLDWSTVESELPRLYKMRMADRSKMPGFEDVYTYWLTDAGESILATNGNIVPEELPYKHREYRRSY